MQILGDLSLELWDSYAVRQTQHCGENKQFMAGDTNV